VHLVAGDYDSGPHLAQARVPVLAGDTPETLQTRVQAAERELYPRALAERIRHHSGT
jgi:folate-dependent phosphoribosylglycinamide formyltransferase PurN